MRRPILALLLPLAFLLLGRGAARGDEALLRIPLEAADVPASHTEWYGVYMGGTKSGYLRQSQPKR